MTVISAVSVAEMPGYDRTEVVRRMRLLPQRRMRGVGGVVSYAKARVSILFTHEAGDARTVEETVLIGYPSPTATPRALPSLLGCNVLQHFTLRMFGPQGIVALD